MRSFVKVKSCNGGTGLSQYTVCSHEKCSAFPLFTNAALISLHLAAKHCLRLFGSSIITIHLVSLECVFAEKKEHPSLLNNFTLLGAFNLGFFSLGTYFPPRK